MDEIGKHLPEVVLSLCAFIFMGTCAMFLYIISDIKTGLKEVAVGFNEKLSETSKEFGEKFDKISASVQGIGKQMAAVAAVTEERAKNHQREIDDLKRKGRS